MELVFGHKIVQSMAFHGELRMRPLLHMSKRAAEQAGSRKPLSGWKPQGAVLLNTRQMTELAAADQHIGRVW